MGEDPTLRSLETVALSSKSTTKTVHSVVAPVLLGMMRFVHIQASRAWLEERATLWEKAKHGKKRQKGIRRPMRWVTSDLGHTVSVQASSTSSRVVKGGKEGGERVKYTPSG